MKNTCYMLSKLAKEFVDLQSSLILQWRETHSPANDLEYLSDFPFHSAVQIKNKTWSADRHGGGVCFTSTDGVIVDVPKHVRHFMLFDANRLFDFYSSRHENDSQSAIDRKKFYELFDKAVEFGVFTARENINGYCLFSTSDTPKADLTRSR